MPKERLNYFGLEYKFIRRFLDSELTKNELFELLDIAIHQLAKRQTDFIVRFQFFDYRGIRYTLAAYGNEDLCIHCDVNEYFEETIHRDLLDASTEPTH